MIDITVKLFAQYRENQFKIENRQYPDNFTAIDVVHDIGLDIEKLEIGVLMVNSRHVNEDYQLKNGDILAIFPKIGGG